MNQSSTATKTTPAGEVASQAEGSSKTQSPIQDYAFISDQRTGALVSRGGSIDWLCLPRFDAPAAFAAILGSEDNGYWRLAIIDGTVTNRAYVPDTFVLETTWKGPDGVAVVTDFMPSEDGRSDVVRSVRCLEGTVHLEHRLALRFAYGRIRPWVRREQQGNETVRVSVAGSASMTLHGPLPSGSTENALIDEISLGAGERVTWSLTSRESWQPVPEAIDLDQAREDTIKWWQGWASNIKSEGPYSEEVRRSLVTLKGLTHRDTGGIVAALTTSLPEDFGGERNWDYRYCWLRDAALTLEAMLRHGLTDAASQWREWLLRAVAGDPRDLQIMYSIAGDRDLTESELPHLPGYADSRPVRIGNGAATQYQADVVGEVMIALAELRESGMHDDQFSWDMQCALLDYLERHFDQPDNGIWEMRGEPQFFTHGRIMMWAAFNEGVRACQRYDFTGPVERWQELRDRLYEEIWQRGFDPVSGSFLQAYGVDEVDASLLQIPHTGFLPADDPAMVSTVARIENELMDEFGMVQRYKTDDGADGLTGEEAPFLICTFWLVEQYAASGRRDDAVRLLDFLVEVANDVGLYAEEYDPINRRHVGNFPQAFSQLGLIRAVESVHRGE